MGIPAGPKLCRDKLNFDFFLNIFFLVALLLFFLSVFLSYLLFFSSFLTRQKPGA